MGGFRRDGWKASLTAGAVLFATSGHAFEVQSPVGRLSVGGWAEGYGVVATDRSSHDQGPAGIVALTVTDQLPAKTRFFLDLRSTFGGTPEHPDGVGLVNLSDTFQNVSPAIEIEEGYVDLSLGKVDVRIGKQKFAWGKLDSFQPTDVINPRRYNDPFVLDVKEQKIGVPALRASYFLPSLDRPLPQDVSATLVWVPVPVPARFPLEDERWFPASTSVPPTIRVAGSTFGPNQPDLVTRNVLTTRNRRPPQQLDEGAVALRLAGLWRRADWALYYYDGNETAPSFAVDTTVRARNPERFTRCVLRAVPGPCRLDADAVLLPTHGRIRLAGADVAVEMHGLTARAEGAWSSDRLQPRSVDQLLSDDNLTRVVGPHLVPVVQRLAAGQRVAIDLGDLFVVRDVVEWGIGMDYPYRGWTALLQVNQTVVLDNRTRLLLSNVDTRLLGALRKSFLADRLQTEMGVLQGLARGYTAGIARATYAITDHLRARLGYLLIAGSRNSLIGQFHDNDEVFFQVRYTY